VFLNDLFALALGSRNENNLFVFTFAIILDEFSQLHSTGKLEFELCNKLKHVFSL
jgi:hypothetical protein